MPEAPRPRPSGGSSSSRRRLTPPGHGTSRILVKTDEVEPSTVRRQVAAGASSTPRGISLRWKIVIGMAGVTVAMALLIFVVVASKAVDQLNDEIDAKGARLVKVLTSIDPSYWMYAIHHSREDRMRRVDALFRRVLSDWDDRKKGLAGDPDFQKNLNDVALPLGGDLNPLKSGRHDVGMGSDILNITVVDPARNNSVQAVDAQQKEILFTATGPASTRADGIQVSDGRITATPARLYSMERDNPGLGKLRYNVLLSLVRIEEAKSSLRTAVFLPVLALILAGVGVAFWISALITGPIRRLMRDIDEVSRGNWDHETTPVSNDEVGLLAATFQRMTGALRMAHEQELEARGLEHELSIAAEIQSHLVPKQMLKIPGYEVGAYYRPSKEVGGDYYDFIEIDADHAGIVVADVSGKGVPGSLVMSMTRAFLRVQAESFHNLSAADSLAKVNRMLAPDIKKGMFVTALYCILDKRKNELSIANAGHNPLAIWRAATRQVGLVSPNGIALGFDKGPIFEQRIREERLVLNPGDRVVLYTDGVVEAMDSARREFGDKRFYRLVGELAEHDSNQLLTLTVKALDEHKGSAPQSDDITIVTLRYRQEA